VFEKTVVPQVLNRPHFTADVDYCSVAAVGRSRCNLHLSRRHSPANCLQEPTTGKKPSVRRRPSSCRSWTPPRSNLQCPGRSPAKSRCTYVPLSLGRADLHRPLHAPVLHHSFTENGLGLAESPSEPRQDAYQGTNHTGIYPGMLTDRLATIYSEQTSTCRNQPHQPGTAGGWWGPTSE
jgi:hypothetical protein